MITKTVERTKFTSVRRKIGAKPYEVTEPRTSELVNLLPSNWYSECKHPFQFDKLMVITDEPAVQSARLLSLGSNCIQATSSTCSRYLCYSIDAESCSSIPKSSKWSKAGFGSSWCKHKIILSWSETKKFHPIRTCVSHHLWSLILRRPFTCILYFLRVQRFFFFLLMRHFFPNFNSLWVQALHIYRSFTELLKPFTLVH